MQETFNVVPGLSDHTLGATVAVTSIPLGAKIIGKHFILDHNQGGPDAKFSMDPQEFGEMVRQVLDAVKAFNFLDDEISEKDYLRRGSLKKSKREKSVMKETFAHFGIVIGFILNIGIRILRQC